MHRSLFPPAKPSLELSHSPPVAVQHPRSSSSVHARPALSEKELDQLVLKYLSSRGYTSAVDNLQKEAGIGNTQSISIMALQLGLDSHTSIMKSIQHYNRAECSPDWYEKSFSHLVSWIDRSLDMYKHELVAVEYPVFVHFFLDLVEKNFPMDATRFYSTHDKKFTRDPANREELNSLQSLTTPEQIKSNVVAQKYRSYKVDISLSSNSHQLLISFIEDAKLMLLLKVINERVNFTIVSGAPLSTSIPAQHALTGQTRAQTERTNGQSIRWGVLKEVGEIENNFRHQHSRFSSANSAGKSAELQIAESKVPLPEMSDDRRREIMADLSKRSELSSTKLPSACFYTFLNSNDSVSSIGMSSDGRYVAAGMSHSVVKLWDLATEAKVRLGGDHTESQSELKLDVDQITEGRTESKSSGKEEADPSQSSQPAGQPKRKRRRVDTSPKCTELVGHCGPVYASAFAEDNVFMLTCSEDAKIRLWHLETMHNVVCYKGHLYPVWDVAFAPVGYYFATASFDRTARLWCTDRVRPVRIFAGHLSDVDCVRFHPNCNYVGTGSTDKTFRLWDIQTGNTVRLFVGHRAKIKSVAFAPDGKHVATADADGTIVVWDLGSGKQLHSLTGHTGAIHCLDYSHGAGSSLLASGGDDCTVRLWDCGKTSDQLVKTFHTKQTPVISLRFSPRNLLLASGIFEPGCVSE
eukprot:50424_1